MKLLGILLVLWGIFCLLVLGNLVFMRQDGTPRPESVIFLKTYQQESHIYRMWRTGRGERRISYRLPESGVLHSLVWSPTGKDIIYVNKSLYHLPAQGGTPQPLTDSLDQNPTWSPDGRFLTFASYREENWDIYRLEWKTGELLRLTDDPAEDTNPLWLPDGKTILFDSRRGGTSDIYAMNKDGENERVVLALRENLIIKGWAQDGTRLYFDRGRNWCWAYWWQEKRLEELVCREMERPQRLLAPPINAPFRPYRILSGGLFCLTIAGLGAYLKEQ